MTSLRNGFSVGINSNINILLYSGIDLCIGRDLKQMLSLMIPKLPHAASRQRTVFILPDI